MRRRPGLAVAAALAATLVVSATGFGSGSDAANQQAGAAFDLKPLQAEGLSGLWISADGARMIALSDRSFLVFAAITRGADGRITAVSETERLPLGLAPSPGAEPAELDSEGLAIGPEGEIFVSTEGPARVLRLARPGAAPDLVGRPKDFGRQGRNAALEALAVAPNGTLYTLSEGNAGAGGDLPMLASIGQGWKVVASLPRSKGYLPVGADIGPDGRLYVLLRSASLLRGFSTMLQRFVLDDREVLAPQVLMRSEFGRYGNLEGLSIWRAPGGALTAAMVSDDNGNFFQRAELVEMALPD